MFIVSTVNLNLQSHQVCQMVSFSFSLYICAEAEQEMQQRN